jgi:hypothetical protein
MLWSQFLAIFGKNIGVFLKNQCYDQFFSKTSISLSKNANIFAKYFGKNIFKIITLVPGFIKNGLKEIMPSSWGRFFEQWSWGVALSPA